MTKDNKDVRLTQEEIASIKLAISHFDPKATIYVFGSRADISLKGGDIDLLILSKTLEPDAKLEIKQLLFDSLEEQKIDIIIAHDLNNPFVALAYETGKQL